MAKKNTPLAGANVVEASILLGRKISKADAKACDREFEGIRAKYGTLTPKLVEYAARAKRSPLHKHFVWNANDAAVRFRLAQAAALIREVYVTIVVDNTPVNTRKWVSVSTSSGRGYQPVMEVLANAPTRQQLLAQALNELRAFKKKYANLRQLAAVFEAIEGIAAKAA
jgi:hypothetical protein